MCQIQQKSSEKEFVEKKQNLNIGFQGKIEEVYKDI